MIRWGAVVVIVAACVGYLVYSASGSSSEYYLTVSELRARQPASQDVRVAGGVQNDVQRSEGGLHIQFTEKDGTASVPAAYPGTLPGIFKPGITGVPAGRLGAAGGFPPRAVP